MLTRRAFVASATASASLALCHANAAFDWPWPVGSTVIPKEPDAKPGTPAPPVGTFQFNETHTAARPLLSRIVNDPDALRKLTSDLQTAYTTLAQTPLSPGNPASEFLREVWTHKDQCSGPNDIHNSWKFLPWHRGYLYFHERLIRSLTHMDSFRLPVWDWETLAVIPEPYANWTYTSLRARNKLDAMFQSKTDLCAVNAWLMTPPADFTQFMGSPASAKKPAGQASSGPHSAVHSLVGGFMLNTDTSPADPLFFAHHANVDRWFEVWRRQYERSFAQNAQYQSWLQEPLTFYDHLGNPPGLVSVTVKQVLDADLGYRYDPLPNLCLPSFQPVQAEIQRSSQAFRSQHLLTGLQSMGSTLHMEIADLIMLLKQGDDAKLRNQLAPLTLPVTFQAKLDPSDTSGFYVVGIKSAAPASPAVPVGGFGVFSSSPGAMNSMAMGAFTGTLCLRPEMMGNLGRLLRQQQTDFHFQMVYAPADPANPSAEILSNAKPLALQSLEIRFPKQRSC